MELVSRLTEHAVTPGTFDTAFSTRAEQAAQLMPVTLYCFNVVPPLRCGSFHEFLQRRHQLVDHLILAVADVLDDAGADVAGQQLLIECVERRACRRRLHENVRAVGVVFDHAADAADLALDAVEPVVSGGTAVMRDKEGYRGIPKAYIQGWGQGLALSFFATLLISDDIEKDGAL